MSLFPFFTSLSTHHYSRSKVLQAILRNHSSLILPLALPNQYSYHLEYLLISCLSRGHTHHSSHLDRGWPCGVTKQTTLYRVLKALTFVHSRYLRPWALCFTFINIASVYLSFRECICAARSLIQTMYPGPHTRHRGRKSRAQ